MDTGGLLLVGALSIGLALSAVLFMFSIDRLVPPPKYKREKLEEKKPECFPIEYPRMSLGRQILRWAIPGWLVILLFLLFLAVRLVITGNISILQDIATKDALTLLEWEVIVGGVGIPLGYLIYQVYWWQYWLGLPSNFVPRDKGYEILKDARIDFQKVIGVPLDDTSNPTKVRTLKLPFLRLRYLEEKPPRIMERYQTNWYLADYAWYHTLCQNKIEFLEERAMFLGEVYHSLGVVRTSLVFAFFGYVLYNFIMSWPLISGSRWLEYVQLFAAPMLFNFVIAYIMFFTLSYAREEALDTLVAFKHHVITSLCKFPRIQEEGGKGSHRESLG